MSLGSLRVAFRARCTVSAYRSSASLLPRYLGPAAHDAPNTSSRSTRSCWVFLSEAPARSNSQARLHKVSDRSTSPSPSEGMKSRPKKSLAPLRLRLGKPRMD